MLIAVEKIWLLYLSFLLAIKGLSSFLVPKMITKCIALNKLMTEDILMIKKDEK